MWIILIFFTGTVSITSLASTLEILYLWVKYYMHKECILLSGEKTFPQVLLPYIGFSINLPWREFRSQYKKKKKKRNSQKSSVGIARTMYVVKLKCKLINGWIDGWMDGRTDGQHVCVCPHACVHHHTQSYVCACMCYCINSKGQTT